VEHNWRWMLGLSAVPAIFQFIGMIWMPESPRWLIEKSRKEKAQAILLRMRGDQQKAQAEAEYIQQTIQEEKILLDGRNKYLELLKIPSLRHALLIGVSLQLFQQFCGINTVMYYSPTILQLSEGDSDSYESTEDQDRDAIYASMIVAAANMLMSLVGVFTIDRVGRRILLLFSLIGVSIALLVLSFAFYNTEYSYLALIGLVSYIIAFAPGMGPVPWTVNSEIYPMYVRGGATSISSCANWVSNLIVSLTFLSLIDLITASGTFLLFFGISVAAFIFVILFVPETKGKNLEDIQELFDRTWIVPLYKPKKPPPQEDAGLLS